MLQEVQVAVLEPQERPLDGEFHQCRDIAKAGVSCLGFVGLFFHALLGVAAQCFHLLRPKHLNGGECRRCFLGCGGLECGERFRYVGRGRQSLRPFFIFTIRPASFTLHLLNGKPLLEARRKSGVEGLEAVLRSVSQVDEPKLLSSNIELQLERLKGCMQAVSVGAALEGVVGTGKGARVLLRLDFFRGGVAASIGAFPDRELLLQLGLFSKHSSFEFHLNGSKFAAGQTQAFGFPGGIGRDHQVEMEGMRLVLVQSSIDQIPRASCRDVVLGDVVEP